MSDRTGLAAHVPSREWSEKLAANPALAEAFKDSACVWTKEGWSQHWEVRQRSPNKQTASIPAPLVDELLAWLENLGRGPNDTKAAFTKYWQVTIEKFDRPGARFDEICRADITDPDALAEACLAAAGGGE